MCAIELNESSLRRSIEALLDEQIAAGEFPGAAWAVHVRGGQRIAGARGLAALLPFSREATVDTIWDTASLTKPLVTAALTLCAVADARISLEERVVRFAPELKASPEADRITFADLLSHRAGFQAWYPLYAEAEGPDGYLAAITRRPLRYWPGSEEIYSCLGFILLGIVLERLFGRAFGEIARERIFAPLGLRDAYLAPDASLRLRIAPTELGNVHERSMVRDRGLGFSGFREILIHGEVNDGNAFHLGGAAGNAGLFATVTDVARLADSWLGIGDSLLPPSLVALSKRNHTLGFAENRGLGWQLRGDSSAHPAAPLARGSFGHTGFTGCSVWCDPVRGVTVALMTNRIHPNVRSTSIQKVRRRMNAIVVGAG